MVHVCPVPLSQVPRPRLYERIAQQLFEHIGAAGLRPGDRLPPERELAAQLGVSRASLAQALVALEVLGVVTVRHGDGAIVADQALDDHVVSALQAHRNRLPEVLDARAAIEVKLAALAAQRRTQADLGAIDRALAAMSGDVDAGGRGVEGDEQFHAAVTVAGHSALLSRLMQEISELICETRLESLGQPGRPSASLAGHRRIADAIGRGDAAAAAAAMDAHIQLVSDLAVLRDE